MVTPSRTTGDVRRVATVVTASCERAPTWQRGEERGMAAAVAGGRGIWDETSPLRQDRAQAGPGAGTADPGDSRAVPLRRGAVARPGCDPARSVHLLAAQPGRRGARADRAADRPARAAAGTSRAAAGGPGAGPPGRYRGAGPLRSPARDALAGPGRRSRCRAPRRRA